MNPIIAGAVLGTLMAAIKKSLPCRRFGRYALKQAGQFYPCKHCGRKFQEKMK